MACQSRGDRAELPLVYVYLSRGLDYAIYDHVQEPVQLQGIQDICKNVLRGGGPAKIFQIFDFRVRGIGVTLGWFLNIWNQFGPHTPIGAPRAGPLPYMGMYPEKPVFGPK